MSDAPRPAAPPPGSKTAPVPLVLLGRALLLLLAVGAVAAALIVGRRDDGAAVEPGGLHVCPMHPEVTSAAPGETCPICRMDLEPVGAGNPSASANMPGTQSYDTVRLRPFGHDVRAPAWVEADGRLAAVFYNDELAALAPGERGTFSGAAGARVEVHLAPEPTAPWDRSTSRVRFQVDITAPAPRPGEVGWVRVPGRRRELQIIPNTAVLQSAEGPYVLVASADGRTLDKRPVEIGRVFGGLSFVITGLRPHEPVLVRNTYMMDAERRLQRGPR